MKFVLFFSLALLVQLGTAQTGCTTGQVQLLLEEQDPDNRMVGFVQYCYDSEWRTICRGNNDWYTQEANVACGQLGYSDQGAAAGSYCDGSATNNSVTINCNGGERSLQECRVQDASCPCTGPGTGSSGARAVCQLANCANGEIRLVNGTTNREGRVEVCLDGRWGTVCSRFNGDEIATSVCTQLGIPKEGAVTVDKFGPGSGPVYACVLTNLIMPVDCVISKIPNCTHSMDLGVVCQTYQELYERLVQTINETCQECTEPPLVTPTRTPPAAASEGSDTTIPLGAVIGVSVALLVAIVIGWICTCVFFKRQLKQMDHGDAANKSEHQTNKAEKSMDFTNNSAYQLASCNQIDEDGYEVIDR